MFSPQQKRGVLYLLLLLLAITLIVDVVRNRRASNIETQDKSIDEISTPSDTLTLFEFDPNTVTLRELRTLGLSKQVAVSIIRYREAGKVFRIKEDLYECYHLSDSIYYTLEPYIVISPEYQYRKKTQSYTPTARNKPEPTPLSEFLLDTVGVEYLRATGVFSRRQAEVFVNWHSLRAMRDMDDLRECYVVSDECASRLEKYIIFPAPKLQPQLPVDINKADSAELRSVIGIGEKSVVEILEYRKKLGGFYSVNQLSELKTVTESNFERIIKQISCDSCDISKIDINFAVAKKLTTHPYISKIALRRLLKIREIKGGWSNIVEMNEDNIFTLEEATRVRPYLMFNPYTKLENNL